MWLWRYHSYMAINSSLRFCTTFDLQLWQLSLYRCTQRCRHVLYVHVMLPTENWPLVSVQYLLCEFSSHFPSAIVLSCKFSPNSGITYLDDGKPSFSVLKTLPVCHVVHNHKRICSPEIDCCQCIMESEGGIIEREGTQQIILGQIKDMFI